MAEKMEEFRLFVSNDKNTCQFIRDKRIRFFPDVWSGAEMRGERKLEKQALRQTRENIYRDNSEKETKETT